MARTNRFKSGVSLLFAIFGIHFLFGLYALYFNGFFAFGATMPERYVIYLLSGGETTFNPTGAVGYHINDLCLQECDDCRSMCYPFENLQVDCNACLIKTAQGDVIVNNSDFFRAVSNRMFVMENTSFKCYRMNATICGFEEVLEGNYTVVHKL